MSATSDLERIRRAYPHLKLDGVTIHDGKMDDPKHVRIPLDVWHFLIDTRLTDPR